MNVRLRKVALPAARRRSQAVQFRRGFLWLMLLTAVLNTSSAPASTADSLKRVDAKQAKQLMDKDSTMVILDVRTPQEFNSSSGRLPGAINIPVQELASRYKELDQFRSRPVLVYCRSGNRSMVASAILQKHGFKLIHLDGGILQWNSTFPPTSEQEKK